MNNPAFTTYQNYPVYVRCETMKTSEIMALFAVLLIAMAMTLARVIEPKTARQVMGMVTGTGW